MDELIADFIELFDGRHDYIGADHGECIRLEDAYTDTFEARISAHLRGGHAIGIYPLTERGVKWGATDLDYTEDPTDALNIQAVLAHFDITGWVEVSRSKGFHVLVFAESWVPATTMRHALAAAHQIAQVKAHELNPKQVTYATDKPGNYLRAPYPGALFNSGRTDDLRRMVMSPEGGLMLLGHFVSDALRSRPTEAMLQDIADLYVPPAPKRHVEIGVVPDNLKATTEKLSPLAWTIYSKGPLEGQDRSSHLVRMTHEFRRCDLTPAEALLLLRDADTRVRKFADRANADDFYLDIVQRVYG